MMNEKMAQALSLPRGLPTARFRPAPKVEIPQGTGELPLIDKETPVDKQIQEVWTAKIKVFNLCDPTQLAEYEKIWQRICDGSCIQCEHKTEFKADSGEFVALLRWAEISYKVPTQQG